MESELVRRLVEDGATTAARCLAWLVHGTTGPESRIDLVWPASPVVL